MRKAVVIAALAGALVSAAGTSAAFAAQPSPSSGTGEDPPECVHATIIDNSGNGPRLYVVFCGTGSYGESPLMDGGKSLVVNGAALKPTSCTKASPCYVMWPTSPREATKESAGGA
jgi:hypothetical protein